MAVKMWYFLGMWIRKEEHTGNLSICAVFNNAAPHTKCLSDWGGGSLIQKDLESRNFFVQGGSNMTGTDCV
jgi:hypothetical protein